MAPRLLAGLAGLLLLLFPYLALAVNLAWDYSATETTHQGFLVYRKTEAGAYALVATVANPQARTYTDPLPTPSIRTTYYWQVRAYNADGMSDPSNEISRQLGPPLALPVAPQGLRFAP